MNSMFNGGNIRISFVLLSILKFTVAVDSKFLMWLTEELAFKS